MKDYDVEQLLCENPGPFSKNALFEETEECLDDRAFQRFVLGKTRGAEKRNILSHMAGCDRCRLMLQGIVADREAARLEDHAHRPLADGRRRGFSARPGWRQALGFGLPAVALCAVLLFILLPRPVAKMQFRVLASGVRSGETLFLANGGILHDGDRFRLEVTTEKDGYLFVVAWNPREGGRFIFPLDGRQNRIEKGVIQFVPDKQGWQLLATRPGEETIYLLFSDKPLDRAARQEIEKALKREGSNLRQVEKLLQGDPSIQQQITYLCQ